MCHGGSISDERCDNEGVKALLLGICLAASAAYGQMPSPADHMLKVGVKAPEFSAKASDNKTYSLKDLTADGPVYLYFVKATCGSNPRAVPLFKQLYDAYGAKVKFIAVMDAESDEVAGWRDDYKVKYSVLFDPKLAVIHAYGNEASQSVYMIGKDGKIAAVFPGFGNESLTKLNKSMAETAKLPEAKLDLGRAPAGLAFG